MPALFSASGPPSPSLSTTSSTQFTTSITGIDSTCSTLSPSTMAGSSDEKSTANGRKTSSSTSPDRKFSLFSLDASLNSFSSHTSITNGALARVPQTSSTSISSSSHPSPVMSVGAANSASNSGSMAASPEPLRGRDAGPIAELPFQLPESMYSPQKPGSFVLQPFMGGTTGSQASGSIHEPVRQNNNLIRRLSNKASKAITRRRTSSAHPSRDVSVGPGILRRRSDSNSTAPASGNSFDRPTFDTESEYEDDIIDQENSDSNTAALDYVANGDGSSTIYGAPSTGLPPNPPQVGPVIPLALLHGVPMMKASKKKSLKRIVLTLDTEAGKINWNSDRPTKCIYIDDIREVRTAEDIRQYRLDCGVAESEEPRFFSILYAVPDTTQTKSMHLIANTVEHFKDWTSTLDAIYKHRQGLMSSLMAFDDKAVRAYWDREMARQGVSEIDFSSVERICRNLHIHVPLETLRAKFAEADTLQCGRLNYSGFKEFVRLLKRREDIQAIYRNIASDVKQGITRDEFFTFLRNTQGENVDDDLPAWEGLFNRFIRRFKSAAASSAAASITSSISGSLVSMAVSGGSEDLLLPRMSEAALAGYLSSTHNQCIIKEPRRDVLFDQPMNEYFISSSHNTYLVGRQLAGTSSVEGYIKALTRGCRCVEVDCWNGADGQPIVVHGKTWTSSISFREAISTINRYAFDKSPFPLWISLEVHCNAEQQRIMARVMREIFGEKLVTEFLPSAFNRLPSPSELMGRILIKTKKSQPLPPLPLQSASEVIANSMTANFTNGEIYGRRRGNSLPTPFQKPLNLDGGAAAIYSPTAVQSPLSQTTGHSSPVLSPSISSPMSKKSSSVSANKGRVNTITEGEVHQDTAPASNSASDCDSGSEKSVATKQKQTKIIPELGCLAVYCIGVHGTVPFEEADCKLFNHILSWDETNYEKYTKTREYRRAVHWHNMRYLMRVYPKAYRVGSSNFNPLAHWRRGVQMSALNWQTYDLGMQLNTAMFTGGTDQSGYVLKPRECREFQVLPNLPGETKPRELKRERKYVSFSICVVSAQQLMRPVTFSEKRSLDPYVEVEVFLADNKRDREEGNRHADMLPSTPLLYRTKVVPENGFNPIFDQNFNFSFTTKFPDLVFVRISVKLGENGKYSNGTNPTATFTAKLTNMKQGYRMIPLVDVNADRYLFSTLLCKIHKEPITSVFVPVAADSLESPSSGNKLKSIRTVFNRSANTNPKLSTETSPST